MTASGLSISVQLMVKIINDAYPNSKKIKTIMHRSSPGFEDLWNFFSQSYLRVLVHPEAVSRQLSKKLLDIVSLKHLYWCL